MIHLRTDWQGIQDNRQWLLSELEGLFNMLDENTPEYEACNDLIRRVARQAGATEANLDEGVYPAGSSIDEDELVFMVRAKDPVAPATVREWARRARSMGTEGAKCDRAVVYSQQMEAQASRKRLDGVWPHSPYPTIPEQLPYPELDANGLPL